MSQNSSENLTIKTIDCAWRICKWFSIQCILLFMTPFVWDKSSTAGTLALIFLYTTLYSIYWEFKPKSGRSSLITVPYIIYEAIVIMLFFIGNSGGLENLYLSTFLFNTLLPFYGLLCLTASIMLRKFSTKYGRLVTSIGVVMAFVILKSFCILWGCSGHGSFDTEKKEIMERKEFLQEKIVTTPQKVLDEMPSSIGEQFQGEWALYSCSMLSAALVNISKLYPETKDNNIQLIDSLISIVVSPEIRHYDTMRWDEDPIMSLNSDKSHISYLSHLAWMISGYKLLGGGNKHDSMYSSVCETMNRRILKSKNLNLPTYPGEAIYIPDMLVAIVALDRYADFNNGKYRSTVRRWISKAKTEWRDKETGLLVSFLQEDGTRYDNAPVKGSYSALNCYYLTFIDGSFAKEQYGILKSRFWKNGIISGLREYHDRKCYIGMDIDAGPILFELSPSGTAFACGTATFFNDSETRNAILTTAEIAGHTVLWNRKRHYLLADAALVGEAIMLAMRTHK